MGRWYQERRREGYYKAAKKAGYRARSAYKLLQIQQRFKILRPGHGVADLGCAPGSWSQVLVETVGPDGLVLGVDLQATRPVEGATFIQGDFTRPDTHQRLASLLDATGRAGFDCVVSDMAPDMSGNYTTDQARSVHLCDMALRFADARLLGGGSFVCKVFEGEDFPVFRDALRERFRRVQQYHPKASRKQSSEVYLVGLGHTPIDADAPSGQAEDQAD